MIRLEKGDCLELMKKIPDKSIDMILCDLPYGESVCKWDNMIQFNLLWEQYNRIIKDNGAIVLFSIQPFTTKLISSNLKYYRYNWYWKKNNATGGTFAKVQPMRCVEDICVFYKKKPTYNPQGLIKLKKPIIKKAARSDVYAWQGSENNTVQKYTNYPNNLLEFKNEAASNKKRYHPTQKPVKLIEYLIRTYTNEGETVLDNCAGSMSTAIACLNTNRKGIMIEKAEEYFNIGCERIKRHILDNRIDLCYNQVKGGLIWQNLKIE